MAERVTDCIVTAGVEGTSSSVSQQAAWSGQPKHWTDRDRVQDSTTRIPDAHISHESTLSCRQRRICIARARSALV